MADEEKNEKKDERKGEDDSEKVQQEAEDMTKDVDIGDEVDDKAETRKKCLSDTRQGVGNGWRIGAVIAVILLIISVYTGGFNGLIKNGSEKVGGSSIVIVSSEEAGKKALEFINNNLLPQGTSAELKDVSESSGVYRITIAVRGQEVDSYTSKDAKLLFINSIDMTKPLPKPKQDDSSSTVFKGDLTDDDPVKGDENAPVTLVEFTDYQCPFCKKYFQQTYPMILKDYVDTGKVRIVVRDFPLGFHENAQKAAEAAECAGEQGKYWEMHDILFENQESLSIKSYKRWAGGLGMDQEKFDECLDSGAMAEEVKKDIADGSAAGVSGTPAFFINGKMISGAQPYPVFRKAINDALKG